MAKLYTEDQVQELLRPLTETIAQQQRQIEQLQQEIERLKKNSSNSSTSPSSDIVKLPTKKTVLMLCNDWHLISRKS